MESPPGDRRERRWPRAGLVIAWAGILVAGWLHLGRGWMASPTSYVRIDEQAALLRSGHAAWIPHFWVVVARLLNAAGMAILLVVVVPFLVRRRTPTTACAYPYPAHAVLAEGAAVFLLVPEILLLMDRLFGPDRAVWLLTHDGLQVLGIVSALCWIRWRAPDGVEAWRECGLTRGRGFREEALVGAAAFLACHAVTHVLRLMLPAASRHASRGSLDLLSGSPALEFHALLGALVLAPLGEELVCRGLLYRHLRESSRGLSVARSISFAACATAVYFAMGHGGGLSAVPSQVVFALIAALLREWRGSLVPCIVLHLLSNALWIATVLTTGP